MNIQPSHAIFVGHVFSKSTKLCKAQSFQGTPEGDGLRLSAIVSDVEILNLKAKIFSIPGLQYVTDCIDDGGFTSIIFTNESSHPFIELDI